MKKTLKEGRTIANPEQSLPNMIYFGSGKQDRSRLQS